MTTPTPNDLSKVITSARVRRIIYTVYVVGIIVLGALQVAYAALDGVATPDWLAVGLAVAAYLGIPVGTLAAINTTTPAELRRDQR